MPRFTVAALELEASTDIQARCRAFDFHLSPTQIQHSAPTCAIDRAFRGFFLEEGAVGGIEVFIIRL